jgi:hypothetical protein
MRLKQYLVEITTPTVKDAIYGLMPIFKRINTVLKKYKIYNMTDTEAVDILNSAFKEASINVKIATSKGDRRKKYVSGAEYGGYYGPNINFRVFLKKGFSKVFRRFAKENKLDVFYNPNENPLFREIAEALAHELIHMKQDISSKGKAFELKPGEAESTFTGNIIEYFKHPLEIEAYAQEAAIEMLRRGESNVAGTYKELFNNKSSIYKEFFKKFAYYRKQLEKEGVIKKYINK